MEARAEELRLGDWRRRYVEAAQGNDVLAMRRLIVQLSAYLRFCRVPSQAQTAFEPGTWQQLCEQAQHEQNPEKLLKLVTEINRLLEEEQSRKWRR